MNNRRLQRLAQGQVTFTYRDSGSGEERERTLEVEEFIRRFLQHVLPKGFVKVRYYGLFSSRKRRLLSRVRRMLGDVAPPRLEEASAAAEIPRCPQCGEEMKWVQRLEPRGPPRLRQGIRWAA